MNAASLVVVTGLLLGQQPTPPPLFAEYAKRVTFYYKAPDPALGPRMLKDLLKKENLEHPLLAKNEHVLNLVAAQLADIAAGKAEIVRAYEAAFTDAPPAGRRIILRALGDCGDATTMTRIDAWQADPRYADLQGQLATLKKQLADPARKPVHDRPAHTPADLDRLWSNFFITGNYAPISRILDVLDAGAAGDNETLRRVARWSLGSNLQQHARLEELVRQHLKERPEGSRKVVEELLHTRTIILGRWLSQDADQEPLVFAKDGSFQRGFVKDKGAWVMARGNFILMGDGTIATRAESAGSTITQAFTLKGGVLSGSRGPNPRVEWKKEAGERRGVSPP
jgi:hypothetical protein